MHWNGAGTQDSPVYRYHMQGREYALSQTLC